MEFIASINATINSFVWGPYMLVLLVGTGIYISVATKFFQVTRIKLWFSKTFGMLRVKSKAGKNITAFQAVSTALASTVGTGNIAGIATAIVAGGPGAVFWMWVSAFFGMMTKYAEVLLAVHYREKDENGVHYGGPMYYIQKGMNIKWLAGAFALFGAFASFGIGNMTQSNSIAGALQGFSVPPLVTGIVFAIIAGLVIIGGIKRIATVTEKLVPFMAILYFAGAVLLLILNASKIPEAFSVIFAGAFNVKSVGGGVMGYGIAQAMRYGVARGIFSNEAGLGSAPIAHAASETNNPVEQGLWGIFEVFVDTIVICTLTALVVLTSGLYAEAGISGAALTSKAFESSFGSVGSLFLSVALICFAFSTIIGWSYYGERCLGYLSNNNKAVLQVYKILFIASIVIGATLELTLVWDIADTLNGLMAIPNLIALLALSGTVFTLTKKYLKDPMSVETDN
ncbi:MAG: sodium:alanine symporter family protein [Spirochaetales bacterium]